MAEPGPHLLGRKPSKPDLRDYRLANFLGFGDAPNSGDPAKEVALGVKELKLTTITYQNWASRRYNDVTKTHWWQAFNHFQNALDLLTPEPPPPPPPSDDKTWGVDFQLDQGATGHCVGFGWAGWGDAEPILDTYTDDDGHAIYYEAKVIEGDPGNEDGAYPRDGAKAMKARNRLSTYAFANSLDDILAWLRAKGTVGIGTDWTNDMFYPDKKGFVSPTGQVAGGHWYLLYGVDGTDLVFKNSWGDSWGDNGSFRMTFDDFTTLFQSYGEAIVAVELPLP